MNLNDEKTKNDVGNSSAVKYYDYLANKIEDPKETRNKAKDTSVFDSELLKQFSGQDKKLLDLGSGTGLLINLIHKDFEYVVAVEKYKEFTKFIKKGNNMEILNYDLLDYVPPNNKFDVVSLFGVMNYFNKFEAKQVYQKAFDSLKKEGILVVKNQMGVAEDVLVNKFSEELQTKYFSEYRSVENEKKIMKSVGFEIVDVIDIYPPEFNRWENTHFYALICKK